MELHVKPDPNDPRWLLERWGKWMTQEEAPEDWKQMLPQLVKTFDQGVDLLRNPKAILHHEINKLMANFFRLVELKITPTAITEEIPFGYTGLFFWCEQRDVPLSAVLDHRAATAGQPPPAEDDVISFLMATILCPKDWLAQVAENRWKQMGGLVFIASQCNDLWHGLIDRGQGKAVQSRCLAWEAEFLHYLSKWPEANFTPDTYQQQVMTGYPKGLESLEPGLKYMLKPLVPTDFEKIDRDEEIGDALNPYTEPRS